LFNLKLNGRKLGFNTPLSLNFNEEKNEYTVGLLTDNRNIKFMPVVRV